MGGESSRIFKAQEEQGAETEDLRGKEDVGEEMGGGSREMCQLEEEDESGFFFLRIQKTNMQITY